MTLAGLVLMELARLVLVQLPPLLVLVLVVVVVVVVVSLAGRFFALE